MSFKSLRTVLAAVVVTMFAGSAAHASFSYPLPNPLPNGSGFDLTTATGICVTPTECTHDIFISSLQMVSTTQITGATPALSGFDDKLTATFTATFFNPTTLVQTATATLTLVTGTYFDVQILGNYNPFSNAVGTFPEVLTAASFTGSDSLGHAITASLTAVPTTGSVSISGSGPYTINNTFAVNAQSTVNGTPVTVPPLSASNVASAPAVGVAEPTSLALLAVSLVGIGFIVRRSGGGMSSRRRLVCNA